MISFIIPFYNVEQYLGRCCDSLLAQCGEHIELIFINDASTDNSRKVLDESLKKHSGCASRIKIIENESNHGIAANRRMGLKVASGLYIGFVDADDFVEPDFVKSLLEVTKKEYDIIGWNWNIEFPSGSKNIIQPHIDNIEDAFHSMLVGMTRWYLWSFLVKRSVIDNNQINFIAGANVAEDMCFLLKSFACAESYCNIPRPLYHYSKENTSAITRKDVAEQISQAKRNVEEIDRFLSSKKGEKIRPMIEFLKLNVKFPLLISTDSKQFDVWRKTFTSSDKYIWQNSQQNFRNKLLQSAARYRMDFFIKLYASLYKTAYRIIYRHQ